MPELPEVERGRQVAAGVAEGHSITEVVCADDAIVFDGVSSRRIKRALRGKTVMEVKRWGKQLWFVLNTGPHPLFHFGMTGGFHARGTSSEDLRPLQLKSGPKESPDEWPPRFAKIHLFFASGGELVFADGRRLGRVLLRDEPEREAPIAKLGFDPVHNMLGPKAFRALIQGRSGVIKSVLLDQSLIAGVGNWIADEVLYQAKIDPRRRANDLAAAEVEQLRCKIREVIKRAVAADADDGRYPKTWLFHHRWGRRSGAKTARGEPINHMTVGGRTTAWVPLVQR